MHIFVINLPEATARREAIERQLRGLGLEYEIFPAVRGKSLIPEEKARHYDERKFIRNWGRPIGAGELGCSLSHIGVYRLIRERNIPHALVLEDDAWLSPNLPDILKATEQKIGSEENKLFLLTWTTNISTRATQKFCGAYRTAKVLSAQCTHGYVLTNAAARSMEKALYPVRQLADPWGWISLHRIVNLLAVYPPCITADLSHESQIAPELTMRSSKRPAIRRLAHKAYRAWWLAVDHAQALIHRVARSRRDR
jgi:glycosyl transferase family 25